MRVTCPACSAAYEVPDAKIGAGRRLRCARCQHDWWVAPPEPAVPAAPPEPPPAESPFARAVAQAAPVAAPPKPLPEAAPPPEPPPPPPIAPPAPVARRPPPPMTPQVGPIAPPPRAASPAPAGGASLMVAWVASILVFLAFGAALLLYPVQIIEAWPPAERLYIALGIVPGR